MAKAKKQDEVEVKDEIWVFLRGDELGKKGVAMYEFAKTYGFRATIKIAQELAGVEQNGVMSDEALKAINALKDDELSNALKG